MNNPSVSTRGTLITLYNNWGGKNWFRQENWCSSTVPVRNWSGVSCNANGDLIALELSQNNLVGRFDDEEIIDSLPPTLEQMWLSENQLSGNLPPILADRSRFPKLTILDLGSNQMSGRLHPDFARATHFSWFDITGNPLTSYFRFQHEISGSSSSSSTLTQATTSPIPHVHVVESLLTLEDCQKIIELSINYAINNGGWKMDRHKEYQTTDIDVAVVGGELLQQCNHHLENSFWPILSKVFHLPVQDLALEDLFVAKYSQEAQTSLPAHRDGSELSFVVTLNDGFTGGGTHFLHSDLTVSPTKAGTCVFFCGRIRHAGVEITKGTRYILAGFVRVYPSTIDSRKKLKEILDDCSISKANQ